MNMDLLKPIKPFLYTSDIIIGLEVNDSDKHASLQQRGIITSVKSFMIQAPTKKIFIGLVIGRNIEDCNKKLLSMVLKSRYHY